MYMHTYVCSYIAMYANMHACMFAWIDVYVCTYICSYNTYTRDLIDTYVSTHPQACNVQMLFKSFALGLYSHHLSTRLWTMS